MTKVFWTNILRSLVICVTVMLVACGINIGVNYLCIRLLGATGGPFWLFGMITVGVSWSILGALEKWGKETELIFPRLCFPTTANG